MTEGIATHLPSLYTQKLIERLRTGTPGDVLTDEQLQEIAEHSCRVGAMPGYGYLQSAIRAALRLHNVVWRRVHGAGCIKCLEPKEVRLVAGAHRKHVYRQSKRVVSMMDATDTTVLDANDKRDFLSAAAQVGMMAAVASSSTAKKLEARNVQKPLELDKLFEQLST